MLTDRKIGFIGVGNMGEALVKGLVASGRVEPSQVYVCDSSARRARDVAGRYGVGLCATNAELASLSDMVIVAVKPGDVDSALAEAAPGLGEGKLVVSAAAGVTTAAISRRVGPDVPVVRAMPNTAALVMEGAIGLYASEKVTGGQVGLVRALFEAVGKVVVVETEQLLDAVTGLAGSGPAYILLFLEALVDAGVLVGLGRDKARTLVLQTALGTARLAMEGERDLAELRHMVTSPGGTTASALFKLEEGGVRASVKRAVEAAVRRAGELSKTKP
ncbi:MAG TPA: pyrroline-5-carboxylate reductase [Deltaproteobacteria bacterium]|nr:pyrroline-5-carboxylate reductase [Deltaproteobacteria bacterium]